MAPDFLSLQLHADQSQQANGTLSWRTAMIGVGMMQAAIGLVGMRDDLIEPEEVLAADSGFHIAGMPPTTAFALAVAVISAVIAYQQAPTERVERAAQRPETEVTSPIEIDEASSIVWRVVESDQG